MSPNRTSSPAPAFIGTKGQSLNLVLYMFDGCPFCGRVISGAKAQGLALPMRDIRQEPEALAELLRVGGKKTVPCLFVDGQALYESQDILAFLAEQVRPAPR